MSAVDAQIGVGPDPSNPVFKQGSPENLAAMKQARWDLTTGAGIQASKAARGVYDEAEQLYFARRKLLYTPTVNPDKLPPGASDIRGNS